MKKIMLVIAPMVLASCALKPISDTRTGSSIDALRSGESISVAVADEDASSLKVDVVTKSGQTCSGMFKYIESSDGIPMVSSPSNSYHGKFTPNSADCKDALGENSNMEISLLHKASLSMFGGIGTEYIVVCKELDGLLCLAKNSFELK